MKLNFNRKIEFFQQFRKYHQTSEKKSANLLILLEFFHHRGVGISSGGEGGRRGTRGVGREARERLLYHIFIH